MKNFNIYFEFYGRKMKTTIFAESEEAAKQVVIDKIVFHKVVEEKFKGDEDIFNRINNIVNGKI